MVNPIIYAMSTTTDVLAILAEGREFSLLNVFELACNLVDESDGLVISLLSRQDLASPFSIQIPPINMKQHFVEGTYHSGATWLNTPHYRISLENLRLWDAHLVLDKINDERLAMLIRVSKAALAQKPESLAQPYLNLPISLSNFQALYYQNTGAAIKQFLVLLPFGYSAQLSSKIEEIAGSGFGLTPSGDDWLLGAMLALQIKQKYSLSQLISLKASPLTTPLSAANLKMAAHGKYNQAWHQLFTAESQSQMQTAIQALLAYGHSSGADALTGLVQTLETLLL